MIQFNLDESYLQTCFNEEIKQNIPVGPAEGLMLNWVNYDVYNERIVDKDIDWDLIEPWKGVEDEIEAYKGCLRMLWKYRFSLSLFLIIRSPSK